MANDDQQPDTSVPSVERQSELEAAYERQKDTKTPYKDVRIQTLGELQWLMQQRQWSGEYAPFGLPNEEQRANLSGIRLVETNLSGARLLGANLSGADLLGANLNGAYLRRANLSKADLSGANLTRAELFQVNFGDANLTDANLGGANLTDANLNGAHLRETNLSGANLTNAKLIRARLSGVDLSGSNLVGADLSRAQVINANLTGTNLRVSQLLDTSLNRSLMDSKTVLDNVTFNNKTNFFGVRWNGVPLDGISWVTVPRLYEPDAATLVKEEFGKVAQFRDAARAYHGLVVALRDQGLAEAASQYRLREQVMLRKAMRYERNPGGWLLNILLGGVAGHGEKPGRALVAYIGIVTIFAVIFWYVTNFLHSGSQPLQWYEAGVLSISSFHGRGFFTNTIQLGDPLAIVAAFEAVFGLFIELVFIATFSKRFLGD